MKILFLSGSLEVGKDGVGDYCRRLSGELIRIGHNAKIIALNDNFVNNSIREVHLDRETPIDVLRFSSTISRNEKIQIAHNFAVEFKPDYISLQFVPYAYQSRGLPYQLVNDLKKIYKCCNWHIMFHELWLENRGALKQRIISILQQKIIATLVRKIKPSVINVSIKKNQNKLTQNGISSSILELFGNIPVTSDISHDCLVTNSDSIKLLYFGVSPRADFRDVLINKIVEFVYGIGVSCELLLATNENLDKTIFVQKLLELIPDKFKIIDLGFLEEKDLSSIMQYGATVGIARSEPDLLGKSGSAISMLEHGLPVWLPKLNGNDLLDFDFRREIIYSNLYEAVRRIEKLGPEERLSNIAVQFMAQLKTI
ncbi:MAG: hypothetical protein J7604_05715 [Sporocytophaga sp.]|uniref:hypothetical protein n=1 Tax=Sporocytophaga sp. TaxID=2231183 RepID=UPI001B1EAB9B|nr:hypothetical protein [Sporocytophaga sp.]MBO9699688.1 hypothetical protein [Sporocytophaga sp.]